ncbi:MetQ/NlpA family ABC transporter substrate-binding protein [Psychrobacillus sp. BL-248-WT-3]|uniref:MetQ/NlpA family ABC transporter substrate-binding protein n=1 Tax=Psychrobacillus sp. BL-248-WT-3 TaxID=2725306 RepID=UPI00146F93EB|nr:MetQ/NlpA family ABC transporter substrate-binding protein [Psychrobacillus sp. BL-248-WT-3]NME06447.1 MetQ/NlpA family ABC transporter substrate-binding protein [Psychrobacillus sp. BL-248-WT-3]
MKKFSLVLSGVLLTGLLSACGDDATSGPLDENKLVVGVTSGPHEQVTEVVAEIAARDGLEIEIKAFSDFILPNTALDEGSLDANSYQTLPFLDSFNENNDTELVPVAETILLPMGVYSEKYSSFDELPDGATFGLPNDPTQGARALDILEVNGFIKVKEGKKGNASIHDIEENPKNLEFVELEAAQIVKQLSEVDAAAINSNYALEAGINPGEESILLESADSPYVNHIVVRKENENDPVIQKFIKAYHSDEVREFIEEEFQGSALAGW